MNQYGPPHRELQDRFDTRRLADRLAESSGDEISDELRGFIESRDMFFIATTDEEGFPQCSYKGGQPGFVRVLDRSTIAFPVYDGNGMFLTTGNMRGGNPRVGILFVDWGNGSRLRFNGEASVDLDDPITSSFPNALFVVRVRARAVFANCKRYVHHYELVERSIFAPDGQATPPVPDWKRDPWFDGSLPAGDPAHDPDNPSASAIPRFST